MGGDSSRAWCSWAWSSAPKWMWLTAMPLCFPKVSPNDERTFKEPARKWEVAPLSVCCSSVDRHAAPKREKTYHRRWRLNSHSPSCAQTTPAEVSHGTTIARDICGTAGDRRCQPQHQGSTTRSDRLQKEWSVQNGESASTVDQCSVTHRTGRPPTHGARCRLYFITWRRV